jgi:hypothetical protein
VEAIQKELASAASIAGKSIRLRLKAIYGGPEQAEKAIREKAQEVSELEQWGTMQTGDLLRFDHFPGHIRDKARESMAAAMLVWEHEQAGGV